MKNLFAWMKDTGSWFAILPAGLVVFMLASAFFHLDNFYSKACVAAGWGWKAATVVVVAILFKLSTKINNDLLRPVAWFVILALMFCGFAGFDFGK